MCALHSALKDVAHQAEPHTEPHAALPCLVTTLHQAERANEHGTGGGRMAAGAGDVEAAGLGELHDGGALATA